MIVLNRIDSRLIHGQVIEAWLPHLKVQRVVVANDEASIDALTQAAYALVVPPDVELQTSAVGTTDFPKLGADGTRTLVLFQTVADAVRARARGLPDGTLNLGNVHAAPGRTEVTRSVFLNEEEATALAQLVSGGMKVVIQAVPAEKAVSFPT